MMLTVQDIKGLQENVKIAFYTTYKIGGLADYFVVAKTKEELIHAVKVAREKNVPYFILGTGANILFSDKGFRGLVIKNEAGKIDMQGNKVTVDSGVQIADLIEVTMKNGLSGFEHFAGIPSTVGGALWQNLHFLAPDRKSTFFIESIFHAAEVLDESSNVLTVDKEFFQFGYDTSILHTRKLIVLEASFLLYKGEIEQIKRQAEENIKWRMEKHPPLSTEPSCGSVFKKIEGVGAGRLIEQVGLKGHKIGGAQVSEKHANFIINTGTATAQDVLSLISLIQKTVKEKTGYILETEISLVWEF